LFSWVLQSLSKGCGCAKGGARAKQCCRPFDHRANLGGTIFADHFYEQKYRWLLRVYRSD
jgi:hypothetical protein